MDSRSMRFHAYGGLASLLVTMGACLFLPAGTWRFWQGWLFLVVFAACTVAVTEDLFRRDPELLRRRMNGGPAAEQRTTQKVIQSFAGLAFLATLAIPALDHRFGWSPLPPILSAVGAAGMAIAFGVILRVFHENTFTAATVRVDQDQHVVSTGPYAIVRHPMYTGGLLLFLAMPLTLGSALGLLCVIPAFVAIAWRLLDEERLLCASLAGYDDYRRQTRFRLIPGIW